MQVQVESFHLNGDIIRFRPQTQKLESPYKTPSSTPAVKGLMDEGFATYCIYNNNINNNNNDDNDNDNNNNNDNY